jgi:hypothetical protein
VYRHRFDPLRSAGRALAARLSPARGAFRPTTEIPKALFAACQAITGHVRAIEPSDLVLEIISIVVAILLALSVNFLVAQLKAHYEGRIALTTISSEMASNDALLGRLHAGHLTKCRTLGTWRG